MAQSVSNDALWEKLSEIDKKLDRFSNIPNPVVPEQEPIGMKPDIPAEKDEILSEIKAQAYILGKHTDSNFAANVQNMEMLNGNILKVLNIVSRIRKQQRESTGPAETEDTGSYLNLKLFKVRKTSFVIAVLGLLLFILTIFCMKQQNDYSLLNNEYFKQVMVTKQLQEERKELKSIQEIDTGKKKK